MCFASVSLSVFVFRFWFFFSFLVGLLDEWMMRMEGWHGKTGYHFLELCLLHGYQELMTDNHGDNVLIIHMCCTIGAES